MNKTRKNRPLIDPAAYPATNTFIDFPAQTKRPEIEKQMVKTDMVARMVEPMPNYQAVDPSRWIPTNNNFVFDRQLDREKFFPGKPKP